jgi:hypothetical protein
MFDDMDDWFILIIPFDYPFKIGIILAVFDVMVELNILRALLDDIIIPSTRLFKAIDVI